MRPNKSSSEAEAWWASLGDRFDCLGNRRRTWIGDVMHVILLKKLLPFVTLAIWIACALVNYVKLEKSRDLNRSLEAHIQQQQADFRRPTPLENLQFELVKAATKIYLEEK